MICKKAFSELKDLTEEEAKILCELDPYRLPQHIGIIMDGNGRWAQERGMMRIEGHRAGVRAVKEVVESCRRIGIKYLTLYVFSKENWGRPEVEVEFLMRLMEATLSEEIEELHRSGIKVQVLGSIQELPKSLQEEIKRCTELTKNNSQMVLSLAMNYSGRQEIVDAVKKLYKEWLARLYRLYSRGGFSGQAMDIELDDVKFSRYLYTAGMPDPDMLIRTGKEQRVSNFLLWQIAYCELFMLDIYWPDFKRIHLLKAIREYQKRERRLGGLFTAKTV